MTLLLWLAASANPASACGGFFCDGGPSGTPGQLTAGVVQTAERVAFAIDGDEIEAHVQIFYEGPADAFAWIVPISAEPTVLPSTQALFDALALQTAPDFELRWGMEGTCKSLYGFYADAAESAVTPTLAPGSSSQVSVVSTGEVGPYETVVLRGRTSEAVVDWLIEAGFDLPEETEAALAPYVAEEAYFLALRLAKDKDAGDIEPIAFRYEAEKPSLPIQLTAVAAAPDTRLEVYVFGEHRAVPESYLHVTINELAINWWDGGSNYNEVITLAADEAGGHAFATDFAGSPAFLAGSLPVLSASVLEQLALDADAADWVNALIANGVVGTASVLDILDTYAAMPEDVSASDFWTCSWCYAPVPIDGAAATAALEEDVLPAFEMANDLLTYPMVSRLTSSLDADEMTVDPVFVQNPDMGEVSNLHRADFVWQCNRKVLPWEAFRRLELSSGLNVLLPSEEWLAAHDMTEFDYLQQLRPVNALTIEQTSASGQPTVLEDRTPSVVADVAALNGETATLLAVEGCGGCATNSGGPAGWLMLGLGALATVRRRETKLEGGAR